VNNATVNDDVAAIFRRVIFPFTAKFQDSPLAYSVDVEGYANMARQVVLDIYLAEHPGMAIELADIRLFYTDIDGDQVEIVSDADVCFAIREYTYKLCGKNLRITSPMIKKEGYKGPSSATVGAASKVFKVSPGTSPSASPIPGAQSETARAPTSTQTEIEESATGSSQEYVKVTTEPMNMITAAEAGQVAKGTLPTSVAKGMNAAAVALVTWALSDRMRYPSEKNAPVKTSTSPAAAPPILGSNMTNSGYPGLCTPTLGKRHHATILPEGHNTVRAMGQSGR
jgi:PB1 domain